jgi:hypothetical protein
MNICARRTGTMTIKIGIINETDENERRVTADSNFSQHPLLVRLLR